MVNAGYNMKGEVRIMANAYRSWTAVDRGTAGRLATTLAYVLSPKAEYPIAPIRTKMQPTMGRPKFITIGNLSGSFMPSTMGITIGYAEWMMASDNKSQILWPYWYKQSGDIQICIPPNPPFLTPHSSKNSLLCFFDLIYVPMPMPSKENTAVETRFLGLIWEKMARMDEEIIPVPIISAKSWPLIICKLGPGPCCCAICAAEK